MFIDIFIRIQKLFLFYFLRSYFNRRSFKYYKLGNLYLDWYCIYFTYTLYFFFIDDLMLILIGVRPTTRK